MFLLEIFFIALGLSMDAFAVSIANGIRVKKIHLKYPLKIAFAFGLLQAFMPLIGWAIGSQFKNYISSFDHWIAFILLAGIGVKMIIESFKIEKENETSFLKNHLLLIQAIATSIDALIVGGSFAFLDFPIFTSVIIIGLTTFLFSFIGVYVGKRFGEKLESKAEIAGGIILIAIGLKILIEHLNLLW